jgi:hypothetical protein
MITPEFRTGKGNVTLSLPSDNQVMKQMLSKQVYLVLTYHFGIS